MRRRPTSKRLVAETTDLERVLDRARHLGFLGPGPILDQIAHAERYGRALQDLALDGGEEEASVRVVDLGAGGGLPSLPLLVEHRSLHVTLVDAHQRRWAFQVWALVELSVADRAEAWCGRAEVFGQDRRRRGHFDVVVARGFGPPAQTVECAAPLLRPGGRLLVSEPPGGRRWPAPELARAGLAEVATIDGVVVMERRFEVPTELPRPAQAQRRAPLFDL